MRADLSRPEPESQLDQRQSLVPPLPLLERFAGAALYRMASSRSA